MYGQVQHIQTGVTKNMFNIFSKINREGISIVLLNTIARLFPSVKINIVADIAVDSCCTYFYILYQTLHDPIMCSSPVVSTFSLARATNGSQAADDFPNSLVEGRSKHQQQHTQSLDLKRSDSGSHLTASASRSPRSASTWRRDSESHLIAGTNRSHRSVSTWRRVYLRSAAQSLGFTVRGEETWLWGAGFRWRMDRG